jgi:baculoviral IAP repeat-containing protein 6
MLRVDTMAMVLNFFAEVCAEGHMRDWLGSPEGSIFWLPLLSLLCNRSNSADSSDVEGQSRYSNHVVYACIFIKYFVIL